MDMFMDKLSQKLTAQEIIRANTAAETEELNRLRNQIDEYDRCLQKMRQLVEEGADKLKGNAEQNEKLQSLVTERLGAADAALGRQLGSMDATLGQRLGELNNELGQRLGEMNDELKQHLGGLNSDLEQRLGDLNSAVEKQLAELKKSQEEKLDRLDGKLSEEPDGQLDEKFLNVTDSIHKECVKVYRNVQAVVQEEGGKQVEQLNGAAAGVQRLKKKLNVVLGISSAALVASLVSLIVNVLHALNVF